MFQVDKLLSSTGILLFMIIYISVCIVIVWVSFLNIEFDCKSNSLNCGKFALRIYSHPHPSGFITGTGATDSGEARE